MVKAYSLALLHRNLKNALRPVSDEADFEAREMLRHLLAVSHADILLDRPVSLGEKELSQLLELTRRRLNHEPLQYLLGSWSFFGRDFLVGKGVLIPRPDTEVLAEEVLAFLRERRAPRVLELCGGSGCLAATIALECPGAEVYSVEKSPEAFYYLSRNCSALESGVCCVLGDALNPNVVAGNFDCILSNPPYLTRQDMEELSPEVRCEPEMALYGQEDGLFFYRELTRIWQGRLTADGMMAYEIGMGQQDAVSEIFRTNGLNNVCQTRDYSGIIRVLTAKR